MGVSEGIRPHFELNFVPHKGFIVTSLWEQGNSEKEQYSSVDAQGRRLYETAVSLIAKSRCAHL